MKRHVRRKLALLLVCLGVSFLFSQYLKERAIKETVRKNHISLLAPNILQANALTEAHYDYRVVEPIGSFKFMRLNHQNLPTIGAIAIPSVSLQLPIYKGVSNENMYFGAGTLKPYQEMGIANYPLASHLPEQGRLIWMLPNK